MRSKTLPLEELVSSRDASLLVFRRFEDGSSHCIIIDQSPSVLHYNCVRDMHTYVMTYTVMGGTFFKLAL